MWQQRRPLICVPLHSPPFSAAGPGVLGARLIMISVLGGAPKNSELVREEMVPNGCGF